jgi:hypothetical protein
MRKREAAPLPDIDALGARRGTIIGLTRGPLQLVFEDVGRNEHLEFADFYREPELLAHNGRDEARCIDVEF